MTEHLWTRLVSPSGVVHAYRREAQHFGDECQPFSEAACGRGDARYVRLAESDAPITCGHCLRALAAERKRLARAPIHGWRATERVTHCGLTAPYAAAAVETGWVTCRACRKVLAANGDADDHSA